MRVPVASGGQRSDYEVLLEAGARLRVAELVAAAAPAVRRWVVISDSNVAPLHAERIAADLSGAGKGGELLTFPAGEENKRRSEWGRLTDEILAAGYGRDSGVIAVGGGVTGDLAGFVAASFMRGIPVVQVPTSLVAMIDASVGGKTGVDTSHGKNLVGAFHPPRLVIADPETIQTLPRAERAQGLAEALKHGAILDADYADRVVALAPQLLEAEPEALLEVVRGSVAIKADVVSRDELESGLREILNFGHTVGHAIELAHDFALPHGSAIAIGMVAEAAMGEGWGVTAAGTSQRLASALSALELPSALGRGEDPARLAQLMARDKKARALPRVVLLSEVGRVAPDGDAWSHARTTEAIAESLRVLAGAQQGG